MEQAESAAYVKVAEIEVDDVRPDQFGFVLNGRGADRAEYRLEWHLDMPVDPRTKAVLGGLLAQSEWRVWRRAPVSPASVAKRRRNPLQRPKG
ncbi:MAG TPA: hypothetical protein VGI83_09645 [Gemmatimonadales bacterium]|jgi:hypothetical protein